MARILRLASKLQHRQYKRQEYGEHHGGQEEQQRWFHQFHCDSKRTIDTLLQGICNTTKNGGEIVCTLANGNHFHHIWLEKPTIGKWLRQLFATSNGFGGAFHTFCKARMSSRIARDRHRLNHWNSIGKERSQHAREARNTDGTYESAILGNPQFRVT
jgi:hypothetical protein